MNVWKFYFSTLKHNVFFSKTNTFNILFEIIIIIFTNLLCLLRRMHKTVDCLKHMRTCALDTKRTTGDSRVDQQLIVLKKSSRRRARFKTIVHDQVTKKHEPFSSISGRQLLGCAGAYFFI